MTDTKAQPLNSKPARVKKVAYAGKEPDSDYHLEILNITLPSDQEIKEFQVARNLSDEQINVLCLVLHHVYQDIEQFNRHYSKIDERKSQIKALVEVEERVFQLKEALSKHIDLLGQALPLDVMQRIGEGFDLSLARQAINERTSYRRLNADLNKHFLGSASIDADTIASLSLPRRQAIGLNEGHLLLKHFVDNIHRPMGVWIALHGANKGGRPRKYARDYLIFWLVHEAEPLTGNNAPNSKIGPFANFCEAVVELCGLPAQGTGASIPKIVSQVKDWKYRFSNHG